jgi:hypothetical protein
MFYVDCKLDRKYLKIQDAARVGGVSYLYMPIPILTAEGTLTIVYRVGMSPITSYMFTHAHIPANKCIS